jgi:choice-of-anchor B domain-containing protein
LAKVPQILKIVSLLGYNYIAMNKRFIALLLMLIFSFVLACGSDDSDDTPMVDDDVTVTDDDGMGTTDDSPTTPIMSFTPCENGMAGEFPCDGYDLLGRIQHSTFSAGEGNDIWGWTDETTGNEYAIIGLDNGTAFVDITDTENLVYLGKLPTATSSSIWRDVKVYQNHAFIVSEANDHGMQVFDLTRLRNLDNPPRTFAADARYTDIGNAHNVVINEDMGFAYPVGTARNDAFLGGAHFIDISEPTNPTAAGGYSASGYTHDAQVVTYNGPDSDYSGREIFIGSNEDRVVIVDITDKDNPASISGLNYNQLGYTHQGWFTEDQRYFLLGDELDEINFGFNSRTLVFDLADLDRPRLHMTYTGPTAAIDHNGYVKGNEFFLANYTAGMRVLDISDIDGQNISETGFFDTFPSNNGASFNGVWSVYPYFESGKIIINDSNTGFFVVQKSE